MKGVLSFNLISDIWYFAELFFFVINSIAEFRLLIDSLPQPQWRQLTNVQATSYVGSISNPLFYLGKWVRSQHCQCSTKASTSLWTDESITSPFVWCLWFSLLLNSVPFAELDPSVKKKILPHKGGKSL